MFTFPTAACVQAVYRFHNFPVWDVRFSPLSASLFVSASRDGLCCLWNMASPKPVRIFAGHASDVNVSGDARILIEVVFLSRVCFLLIPHARMHALEGLTCRSRVTSAGSHASPCSGEALTSPAWQRQSLSRTLLVHALWKKHTILAVVVLRLFEASNAACVNAL
jgi:WD40 repeat protein